MEEGSQHISWLGPEILKEEGSWELQTLPPHPKKEKMKKCQSVPVRRKKKMQSTSLLWTTYCSQVAP